jgi:PAS domain-containing protein
MFAAAFAEAPNGIAMISLDARFLRVHGALCTMLGRTEDEPVGRRTVDFCHPTTSAPPKRPASIGTASLDADTLDDQAAMVQADLAMSADTTQECPPPAPRSRRAPSLTA